MSLADKTVVVIGGSSGIGLATAQLAHAEGAHLVITGRSEKRLADASAVFAGDVLTAALDSTDESRTKALFESLGHVDHIFVSAAVVGGASVLDTESESMRPWLDSRVWGSILAVKYGVPKMPGAGSVTFCSGVSVNRPRPGASIGTASCAAVESLSRSFAMELAPIRFNTVVPGFIETPLTKDYPGKEEFSRQVPARRVGNPEEIGDAVLFLMKNTYVTGTSLLVDGGYSLV